MRWSLCILVFHHLKELFVKFFFRLFSQFSNENRIFIFAPLLKRTVREIRDFYFALLHTHTHTTDNKFINIIIIFWIHRIPY